MGMKYIGTSTGSAFLPKIIGSYESYLNDWIENEIKNGTTIHVVGCAEGYYACGLKIKNPNSIVVAYDIDSNARDLCAELARINDVDIKINKEFIPENLNLKNTFVLMDVEGFEEELLLGNNFGCYSESKILVEVHDYIFGRGDLTHKLVSAYQSTHYLEIIPHADRGVVDNFAKNYLNIDEKKLEILSDELRAGRNCWILLSPRSIS